MPEATGFYCNMKAFSATERERYNRLADKLAKARVETRELPDGYAFRLNEEMFSLSELAEWVSAERRCCPFFNFEIEVEQDCRRLWLKLVGAEGVKPFIETEFRLRNSSAFCGFF